MNSVTARRLAALALLSTLSSVVTLVAQDGGGARRPMTAQEALRMLEADQPRSDSLPPEVEANLINKGKIAEQMAQRLIGLREAGDPHIPKGILLRDIRDDASRSRVDVQKLRVQRIRLIEADIPEPAPPRAAEPAPCQEAAARPGELLKSDAEESGSNLWVGAVLLGFFLLGGGVYLHAKRQAEP